ncbi:MAG: hypothetical protein N2559_07960 [Anaerolineae bacterium]|nr:hypothetical protein [Anaerolineae bacterium]
MIIAGVYSFNKGKEIIQTRYRRELEEVKQVIAVVDSTRCKTKTSREKKKCQQVFPTLNNSCGIWNNVVWLTLIYLC